MNFIEELLKELNSLSADDIIQEIGGKIYETHLNRNEILRYPQFIQDIIFWVDLDTELQMQGDVLQNSTSHFIPNMITALKNIHANQDAILLQKIYDTFRSAENDKGEGADKHIEALIDGWYDEMYFNTGFDIWSLLEDYVTKEKENYLRQ